MEDETLKGIDTDDGESSIGGGEILLQSTSEEIFNRAERLFEVLRCFSGQLTKCCSDLVVDLMQERRDKGNDGGMGGGEGGGEGGRSSIRPRGCLRCYVASPVS